MGAAGQVPRRPPRDLRLDVLRGWMQVSIFVSHAVGTGFAWGIHAAWGISDSSEQFVLLSGLALGSVFTLKRARDGIAAAVRDLLHRVRRLYLTHLVVFFMFAAMILWGEMELGMAGEVAARGWAWFAQEPWLAVPGALSLLYQPEFMGILPIFIWCMLLLPAFLWLCERAGAWALAMPAGLYLATQLWGLSPPALGGTYIAFDPFAWQAIFLAGAWAGRQALLGHRVVPRHPAVVAAALAVLAFGLWVRLAEHGFIAPLPAELVAWHAKESLGPARLLHALALAALVALAVPREARWMQMQVPQVLAAIGRHSLNVFCMGLFLSWGVATAFRLCPSRVLWLDLVLVPGGVLLLAGFALAAERRMARQAA